MIEKIYNFAFPLVTLVSLLEIWIAGVVYLNSPKKKVNRIFLVFTIFLLIWLNFAFLARYFYFLPQLSCQLLRIAFSMPPLFLISLYLFSLYFPRETKPSFFFEIFIFLILGLFLFFFSLTHLVIKDLRIESWGVDFELGKGKFLYYFGLIFLSILVLFHLGKKYLILPHVFKEKLRYFFVGLIIFAIFNFIFNIYFPLFKKTTKFYQLGDYSTLFLLAFTAQAILKKENFEIKKIILTEFLIGIISILLFWQIFYSKDLKEIIWRSFLFISFLIFGFLLSKSLKKELEHKKEIERLNEDLRELNLELEKKVEERTKELREKVEELEKFYRLTVGRELKMVQLKKEIERLKKKLKR